MVPFGRVNDVCFGSRWLLRLLHRNEMQMSHKCKGGERERHAENASRIRDMMDQADMVDMVRRIGR